MGSGVHFIEKIMHTCRKFEVILKNSSGSGKQYFALQDYTVFFLNNTEITAIFLEANDFVYEIISDTYQGTSWNLGCIFEV